MSFIKDSGTVEKAFNATTVIKEYSSYSSLLADYKFFTPAILYWHTGLDRDLVSDFINQKDIPQDLRPQRVQVYHDIFKMEEPWVDLKRGFSTIKEDLSRMLYVCPTQAIKSGEPTVWDMLDSFITSISFVDAKTGLFACAMRQRDLHVFDYQGLFSSEFSSNMYIPVAAWGLYSNKTSTIWRSKGTAEGHYSVPVASVLEATQMTKEEAETFFKEVK